MPDSPYLRYPDLLRSRNRWRSACILGWVLLVVTFTIFTLAGRARASAQSPETRAAANADRQRFPTTDWGHLFYLTTDNLADTRVETAGRTAAFVTSSFSRAVVLEHHLPTPVARGLWRIDLRGLLWARTDWDRVLLKYPYAPESRPLPLIVRADWLCVELADNFESDAGYRLLYGGKRVPATERQFQDFWGVRASDPNLALFFLEEESGVSLLGTRFLGNEDAANRRRYFFTQDNDRQNFNTKTDPLETLRDRNRKHDASEHIVQFLKTSIAQGIGGSAQQYLLANGDGKRQDAAPTRIVEDTQRARGKADIINGIGCMVCHAEGIKSPSKNTVRDLIASGVELYADKKSQQLIEAQYLADAQWKIDIARAQADYAAFVLLATGWAPDENARALKQLVADYDAPIDLEAAARELYTTPAELKLALGYSSAKQVKLGGRLASLAHGGRIERPYFESQFMTAWSAVQIWKGVGK